MTHRRKRLLIVAAAVLIAVVTALPGAGWWLHEPTNLDSRLVGAWELKPLERTGASDPSEIKFLTLNRDGTAYIQFFNYDKSSWGYNSGYAFQRWNAPRNELILRDDSSLKRILKLAWENREWPQFDLVRNRYRDMRWSDDQIRLVDELGRTWAARRISGSRAEIAQLFEAWKADYMRAVEKIYGRAKIKR